MLSFKSLLVPYGFQKSILGGSLKSTTKRPNVLFTGTNCYLVDSSDTENVNVYSLDPSLGLDTDQKEIYTTASKFAKTQMKPFMSDWDKREHFPVDVLKQMASLGFAAIYCRPEFGGTGLTRNKSNLFLKIRYSFFFYLHMKLVRLV